MGKMSWKISVTPSKGGGISADSAAEDVEGIDRVEVAIESGATDKPVELQPGSAADIQLLLVKSSIYDAKLSFKASDGTTDSDAVIMTGPQVFTGGSVGLFGVAPTLLKFTNTITDKSAEIEIFVARKAT